MRYTRFVGIWEQIWLKGVELNGKHALNALFMHGHIMYLFINLKYFYKYYIKKYLLYYTEYFIYYSILKKAFNQMYFFIHNLGSFLKNKKKRFFFYPKYSSYF